MHRLGLGAIMRAERFMYFWVKNYIRTQGEDLSTVNVLLTPPPVAYATDRYKAVVLMWFWVCVLCGF